ncbi:hypothetical protein SKAU_G00419190 [Synaphobranchus kaupii]|uniref:Uncharacterized protein n=1 Tax=Synaphobranchus kaupii TaxID=118154 RepID=A0A9Q1E699_SYNKA|nr:hypothetical protein SKAU_G00419190 [Synaphobranchus kaupii]
MPVYEREHLEDVNSGDDPRSVCSRGDARAPWVPSVHCWRGRGAGPVPLRSASLWARFTLLTTAAVLLRWLHRAPHEEAGRPARER